MNGFEQYIANRRASAGRKTNTTCRNRRRHIYNLMKKDGKTPVSYKVYAAILDTFADKFWDRVYEGHIVAVPYLFNVEIRESNFRWVKTVDWKRTEALWKEDEEAFKDRLLVRHEPTRFFLRIRRSTFSRHKSEWYYSHLFEIRPSIKRIRDIDNKYELQ